MVSIITKFIYVSDVERQIVILPYGFDDGIWPLPNIAFYLSSGTSNKGNEWLANTYFPTGGLVTKTAKPNFDDDCDNESDDSGHILKMSDMHSEAYYIGIRDFLINLINALTPFILTMDDYFRVENLIKAFYNYFITEHQILLSFLLTSPNTGLWGWRFGGGALTNFCKLRRQYEGPYINLETNTKPTELNKKQACNEIKRHGAALDPSFPTILKNVTKSDPDRSLRHKPTELMSFISYDLRKSKAKAKGYKKINTKKRNTKKRNTKKRNTKKK